MAFPPTISLQFSAAITFFFAMMAVLPFNYGLAIDFLSAGVIPLEHVMPDLWVAIGTDRLVATAIGTARAWIGGHLLWPAFERRGQAERLRSCIDAMAAYADIVIGPAQGDPAAGDTQARTSTRRICPYQPAGRGVALADRGRRRRRQRHRNSPGRCRASTSQQHLEPAAPEGPHRRQV